VQTCTWSGCGRAGGTDLYVVRMWYSWWNRPVRGQDAVQLVEQTCMVQLVEQTCTWSGCGRAGGTDLYVVSVVELVEQTCTWSGCGTAGGTDMYVVRMW